jgi:hypothetical protein
MRGQYDFYCPSKDWHSDACSILQRLDSCHSWQLSVTELDRGGGLSVRVLEGYKCIRIVFFFSNYCLACAVCCVLFLLLVVWDMHWSGADLTGLHHSILVHSLPFLLDFLIPRRTWLQVHDNIRSSANMTFSF